MDVPDVLPVNLDHAFLCDIEPRQQVDHRGFPRAGVADDCDHLVIGPESAPAPEDRRVRTGVPWSVVQVGTERKAWASDEHQKNAKVELPLSGDLLLDVFDLFGDLFLGRSFFFGFLGLLFLGRGLLFGLFLGLLLFLGLFLGLLLFLLRGLRLGLLLKYFSAFRTLGGVLAYLRATCRTLFLSDNLTRSTISTPDLYIFGLYARLE